MLSESLLLRLLWEDRIGWLASHRRSRLHRKDHGGASVHGVTQVGNHSRMVLVDMLHIQARFNNSNVIVILFKEWQSVERKVASNNRSGTQEKQGKGSKDKEQHHGNNSSTQSTELLNVALKLSRPRRL